jgi:DNA-binding MarR family transcriptional regulator
MVAKDAKLTLDAFLPYRLTVMSELISDAFKNLCKVRELTMSELFALIALGEFGAMKATDLGAKCRLHKTKVSRLVRYLSKRGLISIQLNPLDQRTKILDLTLQGRVLQEEYARTAAEFSRALADSISIEHREAFDNCLTKLAHRSKELTSSLSHAQGFAALRRIDSKTRKH